MTRLAFSMMVVAACSLTLTACNGDETASTSTGGTGGEPTSSSGGSTSEGGSGGTTTATSGAGGSTSGGSGGVGGTGGEGDGCTDPLLAFDPTAKYTNPVGPYTDEYGGFFASYLEPFKVDTTCQSVVVGLATFGLFCLVPDKVGIATWSESSAEPTIVPEATVIDLADATTLPCEDTSVHLLKLPLATAFKAGKYPFVALELELNLCGAGTKPACDPRRGFRYRPFVPGAGWAPIDQTNPDAPEQIPNVQEELMLGLADCTPSGL